MQTSHRRRHRLIWTILAPLIIIALVLSYTLRPEWPNNEPNTVSSSDGGQP